MSSVFHKSTTIWKYTLTKDTLLPNLWFLLLQLLSTEGIHSVCHTNCYYRFDKITAFLWSPPQSPRTTILITVSKLIGSGVDNTHRAHFEENKSKTTSRKQKSIQQPAHHTWDDAPHEKRSPARAELPGFVCYIFSTTECSTSCMLLSTSVTSDSTG